MKKKLAVIFAVMMCVAFVACGNEEESVKGNDGDTTTTTTEAVTTTVSSEEEDVTEEAVYSYYAYMDNTFMHQGVEITDEEIIGKIDTFIETVEGYDKAEAPEYDPETPKGAWMKIEIRADGERFKSVDIVTSTVEELSINSDYYYTEKGVTTGFFGEMKDYFKSQGWFGE